MDECIFCNLIKNINDNPTIIAENDQAIVKAEDYFREGHCTVILKNHKKSISELEFNEFKDIYELILI